MTNEEWVKQLSKEEILKLLEQKGIDVYCHLVKRCKTGGCEKCKKLWLKEEYAEGDKK